MKIRLALVQFRTELYAIEKNIMKAEQFIKQAVSKKSDIIAFPEEFLTGSLRLRPDLVDAENKLVGIFAKLAKKYSIDIQGGSWYIRKEGKYHNAAYYFDRNGKVLGEYYKNHLWHSEKPYSTPGTETSVFKTRFGRVGMAICWDLIYPETFRNMFRKKAELAFVPSLWCRQDAGKGIKFNKNAEIELVNSVATARAFENEMNIAFINGAGKFSINGSVGNLIGHTQIASPFLGTVGRLEHNEEGMLIKQIDTAILPVAEDAYKIREDLKN